MNEVPKKRYTPLAIALLLIMALVLGWFVGHYIPGTPREPSPKKDFSIWGPSYSMHVDKRTVIKEIPYGKTQEFENIPMRYIGWDIKRYPQLEEIPEGEITWEPVYSPLFEVTVGDVRTMTYESFAELYPGFKSVSLADTPQSNGYDIDTKIMLVTVTIENKSDSELLEIPEFALSTEDMHSSSDTADGEILQKSLLYMFYSNYEEGMSTKDIEMEEFYLLEAGQTRDYIFPYYLYEYNFYDEEAFQDINPSKFYLEMLDNEELYRFFLG